MRDRSAGKAEEMIESIRRHNRSIVGVPGNCDYADVEAYLRETEVSIHVLRREITGITFYGLGGSLPCPGKTPTEYTEDEIAGMLATLDQEASGITVFVSHQPPFGTKTDLVRSGAHVGSRSVRSFIERTQPLLCLSGHIHESFGKDTLGNTTLVNPGPARDGRYAVIEIRDRSNVIVELKGA